MSSRIRVFLLVALMVSTPMQSASACGLLSPFRWLFGCDHYCGYSCGSRESSYRLIDDWLGYGYLRNQQGTLGHYPGNWYRNFHPQMRRGYPVAGPAFAQPAPMPAPMAMPVPMSAGPVYTPNWDPGCDPCATPWAPAPMPVATLQPMTVDRGNWQMVWVPRPVTTMVPQTQWMMPGPAMPSSSWGDCGCDSCGTSFHGSAGQPMIQGGEMQSDCGCGGGSISDPSAMPMSVPPAGAFLPQNTMSYGTAGYTVAASTWNNGWSNSYSGAPGGYSRPHTAWTPATQWNNGAAWTPATAWNAGQYQPGFNQQFAQYGNYAGSWSNSGQAGNWQPMYQTPAIAQTWSPQYSTGMITPSAPYRGPVPSRGTVSTAFRPTAGYQTRQNSYPMAQPWQSVSPAMAMQPVPQMPMSVTPQMAWNQPAVVWGQPQMTVQNVPVQTGWSNAAAYPGAPNYGAPAPRFAGDIMGDHEYQSPAQAAIIQNAYQGNTPVIRTGMNNSGRRAASRSYPSALR